MAFSARTRPKGRRSHSAPQDLDATALRLDSTGTGGGRGLLRPERDRSNAAGTEAGLVLQHGIDARDKWLSAIVLTGEVPPDHMIG